MNNYSNSNSIFLKKDHGADTIDGKITLTNIMETIPPNSSESPNEESIKSGKTEIRCARSLPSHLNFSENPRRFAKLALFPETMRKPYCPKTTQPLLAA